MSDAPKTMDARTEQALRESIAKWEKNAAVERLEQASLGPHSCPLCRLYNNLKTPEHEQCRGCPVFDSANYMGCEGSPYDDVLNADRADDITAFRGAAQREVDFLKSLLPEAGE